MLIFVCNGLNYYDTMSPWLIWNYYDTMSPWLIWNYYDTMSPWLLWNYYDTLALIKQNSFQNSYIYTALRYLFLKGVIEIKSLNA